jgi:hypothetical protein
MSALHATPTKNQCAPSNYFFVGGASARVARCKKSLFHRMLCNVGAMQPRCATRLSETSQRRARASTLSSRFVADDAQKRLRRRSYCFFRFAGVNEM